MPRAILHIGTEKTGTSAIQAYCAGQRAHLRAAGFVYSTIPGGANHTSLAAYAADDSKFDDLRMAAQLDTPARLAAFRERLERTIGDEVAAAPDATFIFSSEHCHSRLITPEEVARLHALLARHFAEIRIIVYLRRQDEVAVSHYSTLLKAGGTRAAILDSRTLDKTFLDYHAMLERWAAVFGKEQLTVARFDRDAFPGGSIVPDFCARIGVPFVADGGQRSNESLRPPYQEFLRRINERLPRFVGGALNPLRGEIEQYVEAIGAGPGRRPAAANARALYDLYAASNEAVRAAYFPDRARLFDEDFSRYPDEPDAAHLTITEALDITAQLWTTVVQERDPFRTQPAMPASLSLQPQIAQPTPTKPARVARTPRRAAGVVKPRPSVNNGYQRDDIDIVDYQLWPFGDQVARGPQPDRTQPYFAAIGAAQVFGRFVDKPFPALLAEQTGLPALNLGMSGAGPSFFLQRDEMIEAANRATFVIVQLMSGRSVSNSHVALGANQGVMRLRSDPGAPNRYAEQVYQDLLDTLSPAELAAMRVENRNVYVEEMRALLERIERPKILLYWSRRSAEYAEALDGLGAYWADFPHFVNREVIDALVPYADRYVEVVGNRGSPQPLFHRETNAPIELFPEDRFPNVQHRFHNQYYPSPEMNEDVAQALLPLAVEFAAAPPAQRPSSARTRDVLAHVGIFQNVGEALDRSLEESFGTAWQVIGLEAHGGPRAPNALRETIDDVPDVQAITLRRCRLPLSLTDGARVFPVLFLRDPISRARGIYDFERTKVQRESSQSAHTRMANEHDFAGWIRWCLSQQILQAPICNYQTRICSLTNNGLDPEDWQKPVTLRNYREALDLLAQAQVGVLEDFDASLLRIESALRDTFPGLQLLSHLDDVVAETGITIEYPAAQLAGELGVRLYNQLCSANGYDLLLWQRFAKRE